MTRSDTKTHGEGQALALRDGGGVFFIAARGPSHATRASESFHRELPADRSMARDRPSPYEEEGGVFFIAARGPSDATRASERVSTATLSEL